MFLKNMQVVTGSGAPSIILYQTINYIFDSDYKNAILMSIPLILQIIFGILVIYENYRKSGDISFSPIINKYSPSSSSSNSRNSSNSSKKSRNSSSNSSNSSNSSSNSVTYV